ncbi:hypothetical protein JOQ06_028444 [Pogonophryne albipinna]|uniref:Sideroflexin 5 n=1 Tax=Pogonophryne albipinna TaxID=1090488 RepID=A0AAD6BB86_9TELE|nr:hypothetical protein JOQ06_028444 [Pogonophryne albipinna]
MPFRMSGFIPFGTPVGLNQSHNACVNYSNRNASKPAPASKFFQGYLGAVTSAVSIAASARQRAQNKIVGCLEGGPTAVWGGAGALQLKVGLNVLIQKSSRFSPTTRLLVQRFIPFPAVATANVCNVVLMRHSELSEGISVLDDNGNVVGTSKVAAKHALLETALTRVVMPMPILMLPPIIMAALENTCPDRCEQAGGPGVFGIPGSCMTAREKRLASTGSQWSENKGTETLRGPSMMDDSAESTFWLPLLQRRRRLVLPVHSLVCLAAFGLALPLAISLFPQMSQISVNQLEPEIAMATDCKIVTYNKGL